MPETQDMNIDKLLSGTNVVPANTVPGHFMDDKDAERTYGCMNDDDKLYHRSTAKSWEQSTYGVLPYTRIEGVTLDNILEKTHLNWNVTKEPLYAELNGTKLLVPRHYTTVRSDTNTPLGVVGETYKILQNENLLEVIKPFMEIEDLCVESGGYFTDGKGERAGHKVYIQFKLPQHITVNGDTTELMLFISNAHDGSGNVLIGLTSVRVVCRNTFQMNLNTASIKIRHSSLMTDRIAEAHKTLNIANEEVKHLNAIYDAMSKKKVSSAKTLEILTNVASDGRVEQQDEETSTRLKNIVGSLQQWVATESDGHTPTAGSLYSLWNGITAFYNHGQKGRTKDRFSRIVNGQPARKMHYAMDLLVKELA